MELSSTPEVPLCPFQWLHCVNTPRMAHPLHRRGAFEQPPLGAIVASAAVNTWAPVWGGGTHRCVSGGDGIAGALGVSRCCQRRPHSGWTHLRSPHSVHGTGRASTCLSGSKSPDGETRAPSPPDGVTWAPGPPGR